MQRLSILLFTACVAMLATAIVVVACEVAANPRL